MFLKDTRRKKTDHSKDHVYSQESNDYIFNSQVQSTSYDREFENHSTKSTALHNNESHNQNKSSSKPSLQIPKPPDRFILNNDSIHTLINALDQKFASSQIDGDVAIGVDTTLNTAAEFTLSKCTNAKNSLLAIMNTTNTIEMKSIELENISEEIYRQANSTLEDVHQIQKSIDDVIHPKISKLVAFVSLLLYIITTLLHLIQIDTKSSNEEDEIESDVETSHSDDQ